MSFSQNFSAIITAMTTASSAGNNTLVSQLATLLHVGTSPSATTGLDFSKKTMTASWEAANTASAIGLFAQGWTITPG